MFWGDPQSRYSPPCFRFKCWSIAVVLLWYAKQTLQRVHTDVLFSVNLKYCHTMDPLGLMKFLTSISFGASVSMTVCKLWFIFKLAETSIAATRPTDKPSLNWNYCLFNVVTRTCLNNGLHVLGRPEANGLSLNVFMPTAFEINKKQTNIVQKILYIYNMDRYFFRFFH